MQLLLLCYSVTSLLLLLFLCCCYCLLSIFLALIIFIIILRLEGLIKEGLAISHTRPSPSPLYSMVESTSIPEHVLKSKFFFTCHFYDSQKNMLRGHGCLRLTEKKIEIQHTLYLYLRVNKFKKVM